MSYERMNITIDYQLGYGRGRCNVIIPANCYGPLAIHRDMEGGDTYTVTHLESGWAIKDGLTLPNAHRLVKRALLLDFDWTRDEAAISALPRKERMEIVRALKEVIQ